MNLDTFTKEQVLESAAEVTIQWMTNVFKLCGVPPVEAMKTIIKASQLSDGDLQALDKQMVGTALNFGKTPEQLTNIEVMFGMFAYLVGKNLKVEVKPEAFGGSVIVEAAPPESELVVA